MEARDSHAVVVPLFGVIPHTLSSQLASLIDAGFRVVVVDNRKPQQMADQPAATLCSEADLVLNHNRGGLAGGFNRGVTHAIRRGASTITLLDQDSQLNAADLQELGTSLARCGRGSLVGPRVIDRWRQPSQPKHQWQQGNTLQPRRMLISSGTTFFAADWPTMGTMHEPLEIDYVDHHWCYRGRKRGFQCFEDQRVALVQAFGELHPNRICHQLGMQLYAPARHYTAVRNLRWLLLQPSVPADVKAKELGKMTIKPIIWLLMEPKRLANLRALVRGLLDPLPAKDPGA